MSLEKLVTLWRKELQPPFDKAASVYTLQATVQAQHDPPRTEISSYRELLPMSRFASSQRQRWIDGDLVVLPLKRPQDDIRATIAFEISIPGLAKAQRYFWWCASCQPASALHQQIMLNRSIAVTEEPHLHLVRTQDRIFIKPLPLFLLSHCFWAEYLATDQDLRKDATGLLLSYAWLIRHRADLSIAHQTNLIPDEVDWKLWTKFMDSFMPTVDLQGGISSRYMYGEISLPLLNAVYRYAPDIGGPSFQSYLRGYGQLGNFFIRNFAWMGLGFLYLTAVLTAMQVGIALPYLAGNGAFKRASYGFAVFCIVVPLAVMAEVLIRHCFWLLSFRLRVIWWRGRSRSGNEARGNGA